jgi:short-subunit dehydrogenase
MSSPSQSAVILITGGSAGLGKEIARAFGRQGGRVILVGRDEPRLQSAVEELQHEQIAAEGIVADVTQQADVERVFREVQSRHDRLDVLVNAVGRSTRGRIADVTPEEFQQSWEVNFLSAVRCTRAALKMLRASRGSVVLIGSLASKAAGPFLGAYPASKFALAAYAQQLRMELADEGVHVLLVCPGPLRRDDAGQRYATEATGLPASAAQPGGGVKLRGLDPQWLAERIVSGCQQRELEIVAPWKARLLFALSQWSPRLGDWLLRKNTSSQGG